MEWNKSVGVHVELAIAVANATRDPLSLEWEM